MFRSPTRRDILENEAAGVEDAGRRPSTGRLRQVAIWICEEFVRSVQDNSLFITISIVLIGLSVVSSHHFKYNINFGLYDTAYVIVLMAVGLLYPIVKIIAKDRPPLPITHIYKSYIRTGVAFKKAIGGFPVLVLLPILFSAFTANKQAIPLISGYGVDKYLSYIDKFMHGGDYPSVFTVMVVGHSAFITCIINVVYNIWIIVMLLTLIFMALAGRARLRDQFLVSFILISIILGNVAAAGLPSVGPCFYGLMYGDEADPYRELMEFLREANETWPIWALNAQSYLWNNYSKGQNAIGAGISAMPSLHVAVAFLILLLARRCSLFYFTLSMAFFAIILFGSVHLGWHYAIDGYASILGVTLIWRLSDLIGRSWETRVIPGLARVCARKERAGVGPRASGPETTSSLS